MVDTDPGIPQSNIDTLLSNSEKQQLVRGFFAEQDANWEQLRAQGYTVNTAEGIKLPDYPAIITDTGLLLEIFSLERATGSTRDSIPDSGNFTWREVKSAINYHLSFGTAITGSLLDLTEDNPRTIVAQMVDVEKHRSDFDGRLYGRKVFTHGDATLYFFGHTDESEITDGIEAVTQFAKALQDASDVDKPIAAREALKALSAQGAYLIPVRLARVLDDAGEIDYSRLASGVLGSQHMSSARKRNGFEL
jgi:hypothetical protein